MIQCSIGPTECAIIDVPSGHLVGRDMTRYSYVPLGTFGVVSLINDIAAKPLPLQPMVNLTKRLDF